MNIIRKDAKVYYLEIKHPKIENNQPGRLHIKKEFPVNMEQYKKVYRKIGGSWDWANRLIISEDKLCRLLSDPKNKIYYAWYNEKIIGYFELDLHKTDIELVYLGIEEIYIGKGFGKEMMQFIINITQQQNAPRIWLHTCEFDSPQALTFYKKCGFTIFAERIEEQIIIEKKY